MKQMIGITEVKDPYKFICLLKKDHPNMSNNELNKLIHHINNNNFVWYIRCEEIEIKLISQYCDLFIKSSRYMKQNQFEFKPFQQVLVKDKNDGSSWKCGIFSHYNENEETYKYSCVGSIYSQCIPYNENTAHLLGTTDEYVPPQPKTFHIVYENGKDHMFTDEEFKHFIETAILSNKDISHFVVHRL